MRYEWYPEKDRVNLRKHGLRLQEGIPVLESDSSVSWFDDREDYGEERLVSIGPNEQKILYVVSNERDEDLTRIISVRKALPHEQRLYFRAN